MKTKMKPATRRVVVSLVALVVLAVAAFVLILPGSSEGETTVSTVSVSSEESNAVVSKDGDTIATEHIEHGTG